MKKLLALTLACALILGALPLSALADTVVNHDGPIIQIDVYSQLANYSGIQKGWGASLLEDKFNVRINIIQDQEGTYATRMEAGNLGDIVVWGANGDDYKNAVAKGMLLDWEQYDLCKKYAPYITENYTDALESNREIGGDGKVHGFGFNVALGENSHQSFFYTWDLRWDLYKQLNYPIVDNLDDMVTLFADMKAICPTDENGNETYAVSVWPDWDGNMVMYVKALATAYYGYDELGFGHYNPTNGQFLSCLDDNSPYMECLRFFNKLYRAGLLDPNSSSQTYDKMSEKLKAGGTFWSIFNYAGSLAYNTEEHLSAGKYMYAMVPELATPIVYGMGSTGGVRIWSIGNYTKYPELCLEILNWLATPEGAMTTWYGPRGLTWDYDENGGMYFTPLGKITSKDTSHNMADKTYTDPDTGETVELPTVWKSPETGKEYPLSGTFNDGFIQINNTTLAKDMINPDGNGKETFNSDTWASVVAADPKPIQQDWRDFMREVYGDELITIADNYMEDRLDDYGDKMYVVMPDIPYSEGERDSDLTLKWNNCAKTIKDYSWRAIYAKSEAEFNYHVGEMKRLCQNYGYADCVTWCEQEAAKKWELTEKLHQK
ncbi:MAG: extracellular solute-binding protein [Clostridia bacterium]|nr:extracellular solute-binding protein [Clostridia bacterium]MBR4458412.1 extracellular solute-binding protein [Clostridia bacterium]